MSFDALTYAGLFAAAISGSFLFLLVTANGRGRGRRSTPAAGRE